MLQLDINIVTCLKILLKRFSPFSPQAIRAAKISKEQKILYTFTELQGIYPNINWTEALLMRQQSANMPIQIHHPGFFTTLNEMVGRTEKTTLTMYLYVRAILTGVLPYTPKATRQFMDNTYGSDTAEEYSWEDCADSTLKLLPEEVLVEYSKKHADKAKPVHDYVILLARNLIDQSIRSFTAYDGYSGATNFVVSGILSSMSVKSTPVPIIPWTVSLATSSDILFLFRANYAAQVHASRLMNRIGEVYSMPYIPWHDVDIVYDKDINTLGTTVISHPLKKKQVSFLLLIEKHKS